MASEEHRQRVLTSLEAALSKDRVKTNINGFTQLGLVEMTRKRTRESIEHILCSGCPTCEGRGTVKTVETVCYEKALLGDESHALAELEVFIGKQVRIQAEPLYIQEQFDVVMM